MSAAGERVAVIGLGPMGQAMTRALLRAGHSVTVWNRTPSRAAALVNEGATVAATPAGALEAATLVLLSLTDYQAMYDILSPVVEANNSPMAGTVLVNLSSDTPARSRDAAAWAATYGADFLTGGVMVPPPAVGTPDAYVYYSGPKALVDRYEAVLATIGAIRYVGTDPGLAQLYYQAQLDVFLTTLAAILHGTALAASAGVSAAEFIPEALRTIALVGEIGGDGTALGSSLDAGVHPGELSTTTMMGATADHIVATSRASGVDPGLPEAVQSLYLKAIAAGYGGDDWTSLFEVLTP